MRFVLRLSLFAALLLIVNVASKCGLTPQYEALERALGRKAPSAARRRASAGGGCCAQAGPSRARHGA